MRKELHVCMFALLLALNLIFASPGNALTLPASVGARVTDAVTGVPIAGATVTFNGVTVRTTDADGYCVIGLSGGQTVNITVSAPSYESASATVTVASGANATQPFQLIHTRYLITTRSEAGGGIVPDSALVFAGTSSTFSVTPSSGYSVWSVSGCNGTLNGNTYTTGPVLSPCTITASFTALPTAPTGLKATMLNGVTLTWVDNTETETGYRVYRRKSIDIAWTKIAEIGPNSSSYLDTTAAHDTTYHYYVSAYAGTTSTNSPVITVTTVSLYPPSAVSTSPQNGGVSLAWNDNSHNEWGLDIWRRKYGESVMTKIASLNSNATAYHDAGASGLNLYLYQVCAVSQAGGNACSANVAANGPTSFAVVHTPGVGSTLSWDDNSTDETSFRVYRKVYAEPAYTLLASTAANAVSYIDNTVSSNSVSYYVCANNPVVNACSPALTITVP